MTFVRRRRKFSSWLLRNNSHCRRHPCAVIDYDALAFGQYMRKVMLKLPTVQAARSGEPRSPSLDT